MMMRKLIDENLKKVILFFSNYLPLQIWTLKICIDYILSVRARALPVGDNAYCFDDVDVAFWRRCQGHCKQSSDISHMSN